MLPPEEIRGDFLFAAEYIRYPENSAQSPQKRSVFGNRL